MLRFWARWTHRLLRVALALLMLGGMAAGGLAWRLAQGPLDISRLTPWIERLASQEAGEDNQVGIGRMALAWEQTPAGGHSLTILLQDLQLMNAEGAPLASLPEASVALAARRLFLLGEVAPRSIILRGPRLELVRTTDGQIQLGLGADGASAPTAVTPDAPVPATNGEGFGALLLRDLARPPGDTSRMGALQMVRIEDAGLYLTDHSLNTTWMMPHATVDLQRLPTGGVQGSTVLRVEFGGEALSTQLHGVWKDRRLELEGNLTPVSPAALARAEPLLAALAPVDALVGGNFRIAFDERWMPSRADVRLDVSAGSIHLPEDHIALDNARIDIAWTPEQAQLRQFDVRLSGRDGAQGPLAQVTGNVRFATQLTERNQIELNAAVSPVDAADLPRLWPRGVAPNPRRWVTENISAGMITDTTVHARLNTPADFSDMDASQVDARMNVRDATVHWLRPIPPMEDVSGKVAVDLDTVRIQIDGGRQGRLRAQSGTVDIVLYKPVEILSVEAALSGTLQDVVALIQHPRLKLFERRPLTLHNPTGNVQSTLRIAFPLWNDVDLDMINLSADSKLTNVHLGDAVMGQDLDNGTFDMTLSTDALRLTGTAQALGTSLRLLHEEDFRAGPSTQAASRETVSLRLGAPQFATLGIDLQPFVSGAVGVEAQVTRLRNGAGSVNVNADLTDTALALEQIGWSKPVGRAARATAVIGLQGDRLTGVNNVRIDGDDLSFRGNLNATRTGTPDVLQIASLALGRTRAQGEIRFPTDADRTVRINLQGPLLDVSGRAARATRQQPDSATQTASSPGTPMVVAARFDHVQMTPDTGLDGVSVILNHDGNIVSSARASGSAERLPFEIDLTPATGAGPQNGRRLRATAHDAGALLRALGIVSSMHGGALSVTGMYDDSKPGRPLIGTAEITEFRLRDTPAIGRILQAMTLYGLVEMLGGEGLGFRRMVAPFVLTGDTLELNNARAFSASLGLTARGRINFVQHRSDMTGTVVPAYFFNSLLGNIPLIGRLFAAEEGGGLFAVNYSVSGPLSDPSVSVNPLSAVTPGFLRGIFGIFDQPEATPTSPPAQTPPAPPVAPPQQSGTPVRRPAAPSAIPVLPPAPAAPAPPGFTEPPGG